jgi:adenylate cyclase
VKGKVELDFEDIGEQNLKNVAEPVSVYRIAGDRSSIGAASPTKAPLPLQDKPSIAVLPFTNISGDPEQEYFADGITEDVITELSRFSNLFVIARNSSFVFKGQAVDVSEIAKKLGVQYIIEGSVRKAGNRVRITAQLIDAKSSMHLWADRYDRDLSDIFEVQDDVVRVVAGQIPGVLERVGVDLARRKPTGSATAFDFMLRGRWALHHTSEGTFPAIGFLQKAVEADENFASAQAWLSYAHAYSIFTDGVDPEVASERAIAHADRAVTLDSSDAEANAVAAIGYLLSGKHNFADVHSERAFGKNPNDQMVLYSRGLVLAYLGRPKEAVPFFESTARLDPYAPDDVRADGNCDCLFMLGEFEKMVELYDRWTDLPAFLNLVKAAALAKLDRLEEAQESVEKFHQLDRKGRDPSQFVRAHMRLVARPEDQEKWLDGYRKAGIAL